MNSPLMCTDTHVCRRCQNECLCHTYVWACPWWNDDEDDMCDSCMITVALEMEAWDDGGEWS